MNNSKQMGKGLKEFSKLLALLPKGQVEKQFKKQWIKQTKCLDNPIENKKQITKLQTEQTLKIKYKETPVHDWLEEIKTEGTHNQKTKQFIKWYKTEYYKISLNNLGVINIE